MGYNPWGRKELDTTEQLLCVCVCFLGIFTVYRIGRLSFTVAWKMGSNRGLSLHCVTDEGRVSLHLRSPGGPEPHLKP